MEGRAPSRPEDGHDGACPYHIHALTAPNRPGILGFWLAAPVLGLIDGFSAVGENIVMVRHCIALGMGLACLAVAVHCHGEAKEVLLSDLASLVDAGSLSDSEANAWRAVPYESVRFPGIMLADGGGMDLPPITIRLGQEGLYRIHLGLYGGYGYSIVRVKLSGDTDAQTVEVPADLQKEAIYDSSVHIYEAVWKDAALDGQNFLLEAAADAKDFPGALAYIRLEPIDAIGGNPLPKEAPQPVPEAPTGIDASRKVAHPMAITEDGHGIFGESLHASPEDLVKPFDKIPDGSCLRMLIWGNGEADICNYPTKVGNERAFSGFRTDWYARWNQNAENWKQNGWDSLRVIREYTRKRDWELQVYIRMEAFKSPFPWDKMVHSEFFEAHPEYHCLDRDGQRISRLSYAYPEVREHMLALIKEIAGYGPDGVCFCFIRGVPLVHYEPVVVEGFKEKYGVDPRELGETDERWLDYQADVITAFMKQAKSVLKPGQRLSAIVPGTRFDCEKWGLDVATWLKDGVVDDLFPTGQVFSKRDVHLDGPENLDFAYFNHLEGRERIRLMPLLYPWTKFHSDFAGWRAFMTSFLEQGADGYVAWDSRGHVARIGDLGYERAAPAAAPQAPDSRKLQLKSLQGFRMDRYHHFEVI
jgi:Glycosyl hydrolase-like 10